MILSPHILVATAIATQTQNVWLVSILSFASHFVCDMLPHPEYNIDILKDPRAGDSAQRSRAKIKIYLDFLLGITVGTFFAYYNNFLYLIIPIIFFSTLPDGLLYFAYKYQNNKISAKIRQLQYLIHVDKKKNYNELKKWGFFIQAIVIAVCLLVLI